MLGDPAPGGTAQGETPHIDKRKNRQHSRSHPIWSEVLHQAINKRDKEDPSRAADENNDCKSAQPMQFPWAMISIYARFLRYSR